MKNKTGLINEIKKLLDPRPDYVVFRHSNFYDYSKPSTPDGKFEYQGQVLTRDECMKIPAKKRIFVSRRIVKA